MESFNFNKSDREKRKDRIKDLSCYKEVIKSLQEIEDLYQKISLLQTFNGTIFIATANKKTCILDTALLDSSIETLESIKSCLQYGSLSDAYALIRKFRDQSLMFLYFLAIVKKMLFQIKIMMSILNSYSIGTVVRLVLSIFIKCLNTKIRSGCL